MDRRNQEGYSDPTPYKAMREKFKPLVYICSPYSGDVEVNTEKARRYCRFAVNQGVIPLAPHLLLPQFMNEETERDLALFMDMVYLGRCAEIWVFSSAGITDGMSKEISRAEYKGIPIRYFMDEIREEK